MSFPNVLSALEKEDKISDQIHRIRGRDKNADVVQLCAELEAQRNNANQAAFEVVRSLDLPFASVYNTTASEPSGVVNKSYAGNVYVHGYDPEGRAVDVVISGGKFVGWYENFKIVANRATT